MLSYISDGSAHYFYLLQTLQECIRFWFVCESANNLTSLLCVNIFTTMSNNEKHS